MVEERQVEVSTTKSPLILYYPGITGGGKVVSPLRDQIYTVFGDRGIVMSSISTKEGILNPVRKVADYQHLSDEIILKAQGSPVVLTGHSLGALEVIDQANALLDNKGYLKDQPMELVIISEPGLGKKGFELGEVAKRVQDMGTFVTEYEQHITFPLPPSYYEKHPAAPVPQNTTPIFKDSPEQQQIRRTRFEQEWLPKIESNGTKRQAILEKLHQIDEAIDKNVEVERNMKERQKILHPLIQALFHGVNMDEATHEKYLSMYHELPAQLRTDFIHSIASYSRALLYFTRQGFRLWEGVDKSLINLAKKAWKKGIPLHITFTLMEQDTVTKQEDIQKVKEAFQKVGFTDTIREILYFDTYAHSTIGYEEGVGALLKKVISSIQ